MPAEYEVLVRARSSLLEESPVPVKHEIDIVEGGFTSEFIGIIRERPSSAANGLFGLLPKRPRTRVVVVRTNGLIVAGAVATPRWFRFPFMKANDLQLGDVWTDESHRRFGLATAGCAALINAASSNQGSMWWISDRSNESSIALALRLGFEPFGQALRSSRLGTPLLGAYEL